MSKVAEDAMPGPRGPGIKGGILPEPVVGLSPWQGARRDRLRGQSGGRWISGPTSSAATS